MQSKQEVASHILQEWQNLPQSVLSFGDSLSQVYHALEYSAASGN